MQVSVLQRVKDGLKRQITQPFVKPADYTPAGECCKLSRMPASLGTRTPCSQLFTVVLSPLQPVQQQTRGDGRVNHDSISITPVSLCLPHSRPASIALSSLMKRDCSCTCFSPHPLTSSPLHPPQRQTPVTEQDAHFVSACLCKNCFNMYFWERCCLLNKSLCQRSTKGAIGRNLGVSH